MQIASDLGGFTMGNADLLRRAMGKKDKEAMIQQRARFVEGATKRGISESIAGEIFDQMEKFAGYGFNKSHSACYSVVAYQTGYLKAHYPAEFMAATISSEMGSSNRVTVLLEECRRLGLEVLPPDVNESFADFVVTDKGIRFGLGAVKNVGRGAIEAIVEARKKAGGFHTIFDLANNVEIHAINKKVFESLIEAGAMDSLEGTRARLYAGVEKVIEFAQRTQEQHAHGQTTIFDLDEEKATFAPPPLPDAEEWSAATVLNREKAILGFYLSGHPLDRFREEVRTFATIALEDTEALRDSTPVRVCGVITDFKLHFDRQQRSMAFFKIEDFTGSIEGLAFADTFEKYHQFLKADAMVMVIGKVNTRESEAGKLIAEEVIPLEATRERFTKSLCLSIDTGRADQLLVQEVKNLLAGYRGEIPVYINIKTPENGEYVIRSKALKVQPSLQLVDLLRDKVGRENVWVGG